jgi:thioredoxin reductase
MRPCSSGGWNSAQLSSNRPILAIPGTHRPVPRTAVFIRPANVPHADGLLAGLGCDVDQAGFPIVDATGRTSTVGVWAAGNVVDPRFQVITSAGAGSAAAIAINADLVLDDVERVVEDRLDTDGSPS